MKKFLITFLILALTASCSDHNKKFKRRPPHKRTKISSYNQQPKSKYSEYVKPSESMRVGIAKKTSYNFTESENNNRPDKNKYEDEDAEKERAANFLEDGEKYSGIFKVGNPYKIFGTPYVPQDYEEFEEMGTASWYGDDFHGKATANGEVYNMGDMTAAHPTLPMPSLVRITNLRNNKSVVVRVNDRGPFAKNRVIDVSERAATLLEFKNHGTTEVKIQLLREETDQLLGDLGIR